MRMADIKTSASKFNVETKSYIKLLTLKFLGWKCFIIKIVFKPESYNVESFKGRK